MMPFVRNFLFSIFFVFININYLSAENSGDKKSHDNGDKLYKKKMHKKDGYMYCPMHNKMHQKGKFMYCPMHNKKNNMFGRPMMGMPPPPAMNGATPFGMIESSGNLYLYNKITGNVWLCSSFKKVCEQLIVENLE